LLFEGIGGAMLSVLGAVALIGIAATPLFDRSLDAFASIPQMFKASVQSQKFTLPGATSDEDRKFVKLDVNYSIETIDQVQIESNRRVIIGDASEIDQLKFTTVTIEPETPRYWDRMMGPAKSPLPLTPEAEVFAQNEEVDDAELKITIKTVPPVQEAFTIILFALFVFLFGLTFFLMQGAAPKIAAIALSTAKSELSQPLPKILISMVALAILLFVFMPFHTFGEDIKLLKDCGIILILVVSIFQAVWSASTSVSEEIEGRTALTLLSKPIHRRSFIVGKILGIGWLIMFMFLVLGSVELFCVAFKPIYEARENSKEVPIWQICHFEMLQTVPGLGLAFLECLIIGAISVAIGTRVSLLTNLAICASLYVLGHLTPVIMESAAGGLPLVEFFSQLISAVVPNLNLFSMEAAIDAEITIPWTVIASVFVYTAIYGVGATLLGLLLFEDRDLA
jgi:ABC-type transport system involved in multi-copper enzyme maturation permease subunit